MHHLSRFWSKREFLEIHSNNKQQKVTSEEPNHLSTKEQVQTPGTMEAADPLMIYGKRIFSDGDSESDYFDESASISSAASVSVSRLKIICIKYICTVSSNVQRDILFFFCKLSDYPLFILLRCIYYSRDLFANSELSFIHLWEIGRRHNPWPRKRMPPADLQGNMYALRRRKHLQHIKSCLRIMKMVPLRNQSSRRGLAEVMLHQGQDLREQRLLNNRHCQQRDQNTLLFLNLVHLASN
jgi:hypothetical protein